jgi:hypothetical protein
VQVRPVQLVHRPQPGEIEGRGDLVDVLGAQLELREQELADLVAGAGLEVEAHGAAEPPAPQLHLHRHQQVVGLPLLGSEIRVADHPERVVAHDRHVGEQGVEVGGDELLQGHEALPVGQDHEPRQQGRDLDPGEAPLVAHRVHHDHPQIEGEVGDVGERVAGVHGQGGEHGEDALEEDVDQVGPVVLVQGRPVREADPGIGEGGGDLAEEDLALAGQQVLDLHPDRPQLLVGAAAVG